MAAVKLLVISSNHLLISVSCLLAAMSDNISFAWSSLTAHKPRLESHDGKELSPT